MILAKKYATFFTAFYRFIRGSKRCETLVNYYSTSSADNVCRIGSGVDKEFYRFCILNRKVAKKCLKESNPNCLQFGGH